MGIVCGTAINDADYNVGLMSYDGSPGRCKAYIAWSGMIHRCYNEKSQKHAKTYATVSVCDEWKCFMSFAAWWKDNYIDGFAIDKDIIGDGSEYSPEKCVFVPAWLNNFVTMANKSRGLLPIGCSYHRASGRYQSYCSHPKKKKNIYIGIFDSPVDASMAWMSKKIEIATELKFEMDEIDIRIYPRVIEIIKKAI